MIQLTSQNKVIIQQIDHNKRDLVLIFPGGGYQRTSLREGKPVAEMFNNLGYHTAIYEYRHTLLKHPDVINEAMDVLHQIKQLPFVHRVLIIGFSAGGHLALHTIEKRPKDIHAGILCYPVVSTDPSIAHQGSFDFLLNEHQNIDEVSLENHVSEKMPPIFLWHTLEDQSVPVENSMVLLKNLHEKGVSVEAHFYPKGKHGLSLANEQTPFDSMDKDEFAKENKHVSTWTKTLKKWLEDIAC